MSHFAELEIEVDQRNEAQFVAALEKIFGQGHVEVHTEPVGLMGVEGHDRSLEPQTSPDFAEKCHIVVRRKHVGPLANDIGFRRLENGKYSAYISEYDRKRNFGPERHGQLIQEYGALVSEKQLRAQGYTTERRTLENGSVQLVASKW